MSFNNRAKFYPSPTVGDLRLLLSSQWGEELGMLGRQLYFLQWKMVNSIPNKTPETIFEDILQPNLIR